MLIRGGTVIDGDGMRDADVLIDGERIAAVAAHLEAPAGAEVIDAAGAYVIPGAIDVHTHLDLPVGAVRSADDFESGTTTAACGGTTCIVDFAGAGREPWTEALATWHARAGGRAVVDYGFHLTVTELPETSEETEARFRDFIREGVTSVKLYMAYPERLMVDDATLGRALSASAATGMRVCVHAEDGREVERLKAALLAAGRIGPDAIPESRPAKVEADAVRRAAELARAARSEVYVVHLSSEAGLAAVREARSAGAQVLTETCPHYLYLDASELADPESGQDFACQPPIRTASDRAALWAALGRGDVQVISTDHCPFTRADRRRGTAIGADRWRNFTEIPGGLPGVETRLSLGYQGVVDGKLTLESWIELMAGAPARLFGLAPRKGSLRPGSDADVVIFDTLARRTLDARSLHSRSDHSPYEGMQVMGWPALTMSRGRVVARQGEPTGAEPGWGRYVRRTVSSPIRSGTAR